MLPRTHAIFGILFSLAVVYFFNLSIVAGIIIFLSSLLIDIDHYLYYVYKKKKWNLKDAYSWFVKRKKKMLLLHRDQRNKTYTGFFFLHGFEILILLFALGYYISVYFYYILIGFSFHLFFDLIHQRTIHDRVDRVSLIYDFYKCKKLKLLY